MPQAVAVFFGTWSFPTHTDLLARAYRQDVFQHQRMMELSSSLRDLHTAVEAGRIDHAGTLERLIDRLGSTRWPNKHIAEAAHNVLRKMRYRQMAVRRRYRSEIESDSTLLPIYQAFDRRAF